MITNVGVGVDIIGYTAKTEELKADLLFTVANMFKQTATANGKRRYSPTEETFAQALSLLIMLANRYDINFKQLYSIVAMQAKSGLLGEDENIKNDCKAILAFFNANFKE